MTMQYWTLDPPAQWKAGSVGAERKPFYFNCADCGAKEPPIAGILSTDGTFSGIGLIQIPGDIFVKTAMFCAPCFAKRLPAVVDPFVPDDHSVRCTSEQCDCG